ncbi:MAG: hypothetical protein ABI144_03010 [Gallionella sp.]
MLRPTLIIFLLPLFLVACGETFPLFGAIDSPQGITAKQQQADISTCKVEAEYQANQNGEQTKALFFGAEALKNDQALQRNVFAKCMIARGYTVTPVQVVKAQATQQAKTS